MGALGKEAQQVMEARPLTLILMDSMALQHSSITQAELSFTTTVPNLTTTELPKLTTALPNLPNLLEEEEEAVVLAATPAAPAATGVT